MKANLIVAELDPSRIDVARRAVTYELIPRFQAQPGAGSGYWMVNRATGHVLVMTTWDDEDALDSVRATNRARCANVAERTGLGVRINQTMDVLASNDAGLTLTPASRWIRATWIESAGSSRRGALSATSPEGVAHHRRTLGSCGSYWLRDAATGAGLALSIWDDPIDFHDRVEEFQSLGVAAPPA
jgi:hypothetical protein